jgi:hypothetical protein
MKMSFDIEKFCNEVEQIFEHDVHKKYFDAKLPNSGGDIEEVCRIGLDMLMKNTDTLREATL